MGRERGSLGSDKITAAKIIAITIYFLLLALFMFFSANGTQAARDLANFYFAFGILALVWVLADIVIVKKMGHRIKGVDLPDTITYEPESPVFGNLGKKFKAGLFLFAIFFAAFILLTSSQKSTLSLVQSPTFQAVDPGPYGSALMSGIAALPENWFFFGAILGTMFAGFYFLTGKRFWVSIVLVMLLNPLVFVFYHIGRYGESPQALDQVWFFGLVCTGTTIATGSLIFCDAWHFANNFGVTFFATTGGSLLLPVGLFVFLSILGSVAYLRGGKNA